MFKTEQLSGQQQLKNLEYQPNHRLQRKPKRISMKIKHSIDKIEEIKEILKFLGLGLTMGMSEKPKNIYLKN